MSAKITSINSFDHLRIGTLIVDKATYNKCAGFFLSWLDQIQRSLAANFKLLKQLLIMLVLRNFLGYLETLNINVFEAVGLRH